MPRYKWAAMMIISFRIQNISANMFSNRKEQSLCLNFIPKPKRKRHLFTAYSMISNITKFNLNKL